MPTTKTTKAAQRGQLRAITRLSLRKSPDKGSPLWDEWHQWEAGAVFTPPAHMDVARALERGIAEVPKPGTKTRRSKVEKVTEVVIKEFDGAMKELG